MGSNDKLWPDLDLGRRSNWERGVCCWKCNPKTGVGQILNYILNTSAVIYFSKTQNLHVNDKVRTDLDLHNRPNFGSGVYPIDRPYPKVGVGQIWKQYLKQLKKTMHTFENLNIVITRTRTLTRTPTDANDWVTT